MTIASSKTIYQLAQLSCDQIVPNLISDLFFLLFVKTQTPRHREVSQSLLIVSFLWKRYIFLEIIS